jgi:hypothetical protein
MCFHLIPNGAFRIEKIKGISEGKIKVPPFVFQINNITFAPLFRGKNPSFAQAIEEKAMNY